jgi:hypothetical protein
MSSGRSASMSIEALNQQSKAPSTGNLRGDRAASAMHPAPVHSLQKCAELGGRQPHEDVLDAEPLEAAERVATISRVWAPSPIIGSGSRVSSTHWCAFMAN